MASCFSLTNLSLSHSGPRIRLATKSSSCSTNTLLFFNSYYALTSPLPVFPHQLSVRSPSRRFSHSSSLSSHRNGRRLLFSHRCCYSAADSATTTSVEKDDSTEELQTSDNDVDFESLPRVEILLKLYKESVLSGDEESAIKIEAALRVIEARKDQFIEKALHLSSEIKALRDKSIRTQADFDNFRKTFEKDKLSITVDRKADLVESLLVLIDSFDRARMVTKPETEKEKKIETSYQGIYKQFVEVMKSLQVAAIPAVGMPFDPSLHESVAREESEEFKEGIVMQEIRRGFFLGDRVLRQSKVKVSSGPGTKKVGPET